MRTESLLLRRDSRGLSLLELTPVLLDALSIVEASGWLPRVLILRVVLPLYQVLVCSRVAPVLQHMLNLIGRLTAVTSTGTLGDQLDLISWHLAIQQVTSSVLQHIRTILRATHDLI